MSADNIVLIWKRGGTYRAYDCWSESEGGEPRGEPLAESRSMVGIVKAVHSYMTEHIVEYGYRFMNLDGCSEA